MLILFVKLVDCHEIKNSIQNSKQISYQNIFDSLCEIIDENMTIETNIVDSSKNEAHHAKSLLKKVAEKILNNGLLVFFPSEKERKECFLYMVEKNTDFLNSKDTKTNLENSYMTKSDMSLKRPSTKLLFEAFCNLFSSNKSNLIQHLNKSSSQIMYEDSNDCKKMIYLIEKIMNLSFVLNESLLKEAPIENAPDRQDNLINAVNNLLISIQSFFFYTIKEQLENNHDKTKSHMEKNIKDFVAEYTLLLMKKSTQIIKKFASYESFEEKNFRKSYNLSLFYNFVLWLIEIFNKLDLVTCTNLVETLIDFYKEIECIIQERFKSDKHGETEKVLKTWTFNSKTKSSMSDVSMDYNYPLANCFIIDFDSNSNLINSDPVSE